MSKKQTAVDFFFSELQRMQYFIGNDMLQAYNEAKAMEREQIVEAFRDGNWLIRMTPEECEQYYNETYGGDQ